MLTTPYGKAWLLRINWRYGVKVQLQSGQTTWFAFWEVSLVMLTPREALSIQAKQLDFYQAQFPQLREAAEKANNLDGLDLDKPYAAKDLVLRIPRGCFLGHLIGVSL